MAGKDKEVPMVETVTDADPDADIILPISLTDYYSMLESFFKETDEDDKVPAMVSTVKKTKKGVDYTVTAVNLTCTDYYDFALPERKKQYLKDLCKEFGVHDSVKLMFKPAFTYLQEFWNMTEYNLIDPTYSALAKCVVQSHVVDANGNVQSTFPMIDWSALDVLVTAYYFNKVWFRVNRRAIDNQLAHLADGESAVMATLPEEQVLTEASFAYLLKWVNDRVVFPKIRKLCTDTLSFFGSEKRRELKAVLAFASHSSNGQALQICGHIVQAYFDDLQRRLKKIKKLTCNIKRELVPDDDELQGEFVFLPWSINYIWNMIESACSQSSDYNVMELAPCLHRSICGKKIENTRPRKDWTNWAPKFELQCQKALEKAVEEAVEEEALEEESNE